MALFTIHRIADKFSHAGTATVAEITERVRAARKEGLLPDLGQGEAIALVRKGIAAQRPVRTKRRDRAAKRDPLAAPLSERAAQRSARLARLAVSGLYREAYQGHEVKILFGTPSAEATTSRDWTIYRGQFRGWPAMLSEHAYTIPPLWCVRVEKRGLAVCDGLFTLDAERIPGSGPELYKAVWVEQGRGTSLKTVRGYIARQGEITYHAGTAKAALIGLRRKLGLLPPRRKVDLKRLVERYGDVLVTHAHARGLVCPSGAKNWCNVTGLDFNQESLTVAELVAGYKIRPLPEVLRVIRRAIKECRRWERIQERIQERSRSESRPTVRFDAEGGFRIGE